MEEWPVGIYRPESDGFPICKEEDDNNNNNNSPVKGSVREKERQPE